METPRIIIFTCENQIYSNYIIKHLLKTKHPLIKCIVTSTMLYPNKNTYQALGKYYKNAGLKYIFPMAAKQMLFKYFTKLNKLFHLFAFDSNFYSYSEMAKRLSIPILETSNINDDKFLEKMASFKPNLLMSIYSNQIIKGKTLACFESGCVNLHPAPLPHYKGISPIFWGLSNGEKSFGITLHSVPDEKIDTGGLISQEILTCKNGDTEHSLYLKLSKKGLQLIIGFLETIENGAQIKQNKQDDNIDNYYSIPTKKAVRDFLKNGNKFFLLRELFLSYNHPRFYP